ncbi:MAG: pitrilysin family protein [Kofleriaceae bacterium]
MKGLLLVLAACGGAPTIPPPAVPPTQEPPPALAPPTPQDPAPKIEGNFTDAWVHGIHVLVKRNAKSEATVTQVFLRGGVRNWTAKNAGIEGIALAAAVHGGTVTLPKAAFVQHMLDLGSTLESASSEDYSSLSAWSLTPKWDDTFAQLTAAFLQPALPPEQLELERQRVLATLATEESSPDSLLDRYTQEILYKGHPYANRAIGTKDAVTAITADQIRAHLAMLRDPNRMVVVVVGDVDAQHVIDSVKKAFGGLSAAYHEAAMPAISPAPAKLTVFEQKLPTNYIQANVFAPAISSPDFYPAWLGMSQLSTWEFKEVRTKRNLSYAPAAFLSWAQSFPMASLYVTAVDGKATMAVMFDQAKRLRDEPIPASELEATKSQFVTRLFMGAEDATGQARMLGRAILLAGDWHMVQDLATRIRAVTAAQIQAWAKAHLTHFQTIVIGDPAKVDRAALEGF